LPTALRVALRPPRATDAAECVALSRRSRRFHAGLAAPARTAAAYHVWLRRSRSPQCRSWLIVRRADRVIVGAIELSQIVGGRFRSAYLGYYIGASFARRGYMREALTLALALAFGRLRLHRVEANIQPHNRPSLRLVKRLGFRREGYSPRYLNLGGRWRDHERWALLVEEWRRGAKERPNKRLKLAGAHQ
jgi:[ribosomal protein S5]-alanine N-acetyltransferase